jgi:hypothetical protein
MAGGKLWTQEEKYTLVDMFSTHYNEDIAKALGRTVISVNTMGFKMGLLKTQEFIDSMRIRNGSKNLRPKKLYTFDEDFFNRIDTEAKAYFLGFIYADGCIHNYIPNKYVMQIMINKKDKKILELLCKETQMTKPIRDTTLDRVVISFHSSKMFNDLVSHGIVPRKTYSDIFPRDVSSEFFHHYIRGVFDGDGCICVKGKKVQAQITGKLSFCQWLKYNISSILGVGGYITTPKETYSNWGLTGVKQLQKFGQWLYKDATIFLERKNEKFLKGGLL